MPWGPELQTLNTPASWCNAAGRVDRSACAAITLAGLRRFGHRPAWRESRGESQAGALRKSVKVWSEARSKLHVTSQTIEDLLSVVPPRKLSGDWRGQKSQAMHVPNYGRAKYRCRGNLVPLESVLPINPNQGATRGKTHGLPGPMEWSQAIELERWRLHATLPYPFLICPDCREKCKVLLLPLAWEEELRDARLAQLYLESHPARTEEARASANRLYERYRVLFAPRRFVCKRCLGVRYGYGDRPPRPVQDGPAR